MLSLQRVVTQHGLVGSTVTDLRDAIGKLPESMKSFEIPSRTLSDYKDFEMERTSQMITTEKIVVDDKGRSV